MTEAALSRDPDAALGKLTVEDVSFLIYLRTKLMRHDSSDSSSRCKIRDNPKLVRQAMTTLASALALIVLGYTPIMGPLHSSGSRLRLSHHGLAS